MHLKLGLVLSLISQEGRPIAFFSEKLHEEVRLKTGK